MQSASDQTAKTKPFRLFVDYLETPVDSASVCLFRILFGLSLLGFIWMDYSRGLIYSLFVQPACFFPFFPFIARLPEQPMYALWVGLAGLAIFIALGLCYRTACALFGLGFTYLLLVEKTFYQNHIYFICLLCFLFTIIPANKMFSLDRRLWGKSWPETMARWELFLIRAQIVIVYVYAGIAKLNSDWLQGRPMDQWLKMDSHLPIIGPYLLHPAAPFFVSYAGIAVDFGLGFLLLFKRTFWLGVAIALIFHISNAFLLDIDIFPWLMLATLVLFPASNWPRRFMARAMVMKRPNSPYEIKSEEGLCGISAEVSTEAKDANAAPETKAPQVKRRAGESFHWGVIFALAYFTVQLLIPLRHYLYPGETSWTEYGHRFSWRMMLRRKVASSFNMVALDPGTAYQYTIGPLNYLTLKQCVLMVQTPDMILQFAHFVANRLEKKTGRRPVVHVQCIVSLNGRQPSPLVDPNVDLASQKESIFPMSWVLPAPPQR